MLTIAGGIILAFFGIIIIILILNNLGAVLKGLAYLLGFVVIISVILYIIIVDNKPVKASSGWVMAEGYDAPTAQEIVSQGTSNSEIIWDSAEDYNPTPPIEELTFIEVIIQFDKKIVEARPEDKDVIETARAEYIASEAKRRPMTAAEIEKMMERYYDSL